MRQVWRWRKISIVALFCRLQITARYVPYGLRRLSVISAFPCRSRTGSILEGKRKFSRPSIACPRQRKACLGPNADIRLRSDEGPQVEYVCFLEYMYLMKDGASYISFLFSPSFFTELLCVFQQHLFLPTETQVASQYGRRQTQRTSFSA